MKYSIVVLSATKRTTVDVFDKGCEMGNSRVSKPWVHKTVFTRAVDVFRDIVGDPKIRAKDIGTMDPNVYMDTKDGGPRVVSDNTAAGRYRMKYDRIENKDAGKPTRQEIARWKRGEETLWLADYEVMFELRIVGLDEEELAKTLGINHW